MVSPPPPFSLLLLIPVYFISLSFLSFFLVLLSSLSFFSFFLRFLSSLSFFSFFPAQVRCRKQVGGEVHSARTRGDLTNRQICDMFKDSDYYNQCPAKERVGWNHNDVRSNMCRCVRKPPKEFCVDVLKSNTRKSVHTLVKMIEEKKGGGTRSSAAYMREGLSFKNEHGMSALTMCPEIEYSGMALGGKVFMGPRWSCVSGRCNSCGVNKFFVDHIKLPVSMQETVILQRFEDAKRVGKTKEWTVKELKKTKRTLQEVLNFVKKDIAEFRLHAFKDKYRRRTWALHRAHLESSEAVSTCDYAASLSFASCETATGVAEVHGHLEVFVVSTNRRRVGGNQPNDMNGTDVFTNHVFYFYSKASGKNKDNDRKAHEVHQAEVLRIMKERYGITKFYQMSDGSSAQYQNRHNVSNIGARKDSDEVDFVHIFCEPACGKGAHDGAGKIAGDRIRKAQQRKDYIPDAYYLFLDCKNLQPLKAPAYKEYEADNNWRALKDIKGSMGFDEYHWKYSTCDEVEFNKVKKLHKENDVLFVDRETRVVTNDLANLKQRRVVVGLPGGKVALQALPCWCTGCRAGAECLHDEVSGKSDRLVENRVLIEGGSSHKISTFELKGGAGEGAFGEGKLVQRLLVDTEVKSVTGSDHLKYTNDKALEKQVGERQVIVFRGEGGEEGGEGGWAAGVVQTSNGAELVVHVMVRTGGKVVNEPDVVVVKKLVVLASHTQPQQRAQKLALGNDVITKLNNLYP